MTPEREQDASNLLYDAWMAGDVIEALPGPVRPATREEGYGIQARLEARSPRALYGWKIAATGKEGQRHINVDGPLAGRLVRFPCFCQSYANRLRVAGASRVFP